MRSISQIAKNFPKYAELSQPQPLELDAAQALLASDEALIAYLVGEDESWLWVLRRRDQAAMHRIALGATRRWRRKSRRCAIALILTLTPT